MMVAWTSTSHNGANSVVSTSSLWTVKSMRPMMEASVDRSGRRPVSDTVTIRSKGMMNLAVLPLMSVFSKNDETEIVLNIINCTDGSEETDSRAGDFEEYDSAVFRQPDNRSLNSVQKGLFEAKRRQFGDESDTVH